MMMDALRGARSGVTDMPHAGRDTLWAYAPVEPGGTSLVILVPKADVVAQAQTARTYIRSHAASDEGLDVVVRRVNELISDDMHQTGRFMTLFLLELTGRGAVRWVRTGHDPALLYDPAGDRFEELAGVGLPLGVIRDAAFELRELPCLPPGRIIVIGTDGIWETTSPEGVMFGKERFKDVIRANRNADAAGMVRAMVAALNEFRGAAKKKDDMTVAVVKIPPEAIFLQ